MKLSAERRMSPLKAGEAIHPAEEVEEVRPNEFYRTKVPTWIKTLLEQPIKFSPNDPLLVERILLRSIVKKTVILSDALRGIVKTQKQRYDRFIIQESLNNNIADGVSESLAELKQAQLMLGDGDGMNSVQLEKLRPVLKPENLINAEGLTHEDRLKFMFDGAQLFPEFQSAYREYLRTHMKEIFVYIKDEWSTDSNTVPIGFFELKALALLIPEERKKIQDFFAEKQAEWEVELNIQQESLRDVWAGLECFMILDQEHIGIDADGRIFLTPEVVHTTTSQDLPPRQII